MAILVKLEVYVAILLTIIMAFSIKIREGHAMIQRTSSQPPFSLEKFLNISHLFDESRFRYFENGIIKHNFRKYIEQMGLLSNWKSQILCDGKGHARSLSCDCYAGCLKFKTCCADAFWNNNSSFTDIENYTRTFFSDAQQRKNYKCQEAFPFASNGGYKSGSYYMISTCPGGKVESYENELCASLNTTLGPSTIPVLGSDRHLYKNLYCAKCHNVDEFEIVSIKLNCNKNKSSCRLLIKNDTGNECNPLCHNKGECKPGNKYYEKCYSHAGNYKGYDNIFCYQCMKGEITELSRPLMKDFLYCMSSQVGTPYPYSWSSLLTLTDSSDRDIRGGCSDKQVFSLLTNGCLRLSCPEGFKAIKSKCMKMISGERKTAKRAKQSEYFDDVFMNNCFIKNETRLYATGISDVNSFFNASFFRNLDKDSTIFSVHENEETNSKQSAIIVEMKNITNSLKRSLLSDTGLVNSKFLVGNSSILISSQLAPFQFPQKLNFSNIFMHNNLCEKPLLLDNNNITFSNSCHASYRGETIENHNLSVWIDIRNGKLKKLIYTCSSQLLKLCPYQFKKFKIIGNQTTSNHSKIKMINVILKSDNRCVSSVQETVWYTTVAKISGYVSLLGSMLSIVSYTFLILTFILFKELKTLPGYCVLSMSINLFLADILYVLGIVLYMTGFSGSINVCLPIGSLMHLFLLSGQFWSVVMAIDVSLNVFLTKLVFSSGTKKKFIIYCLITYSLAIVFAAVGVIFNRFNLLDAEYNKNKICALSGFYSRLILYLTPLAISTLIGIIVLCVSICLASKTNRENSKTLGDDKRRKKINFTNIALKLVIICGLSEAIGFIQVYKTGYLTNTEDVFNSVFGFLYSVTKGCRGVMLCIVYLYNERVKKFYRGRLSRHTRSSSENEMTNMSFNKSS